jgi:endonuclease/exonuclease/phosphatase (EEP) superfamily protein YafD
VLLLALLPAWLGLFGAWDWRLDLLAHFRWQYVAVALAVMACAALGRMRVVLGLALLTLLLNAAVIGRVAWSSGPRDTGMANDFSLRVLSYNVLTSNQRRQATLDYLLQSGADVIVLLEVDDRWMDVLAPLQQRYPHHLAAPSADNFGIALFSRVPLEQAGLLHLTPASAASLTATLTHQGRRLTVIGTHPVPPLDRDWARARDAQLAALSAHVGQLGEPVLVVGDLNATPWSQGLRIATAGPLQFRSFDAPVAPTWRARSPVALPIDHALCTAPLVITQRSVGPDLGSDHRPMLYTFGWALRAHEPAMDRQQTR